MAQPTQHKSEGKCYSESAELNICGCYYSLPYQGTPCTQNPYVWLLRALYCALYLVVKDKIVM